MHRYAMTYDPRTGNPFARIVERWLQSPLSEDPLEAVVQMLRTEASYHREFANAGAAKAFEHAASYVEMAIAAIRDAEVDYELAARISQWSLGTIKNKKSQGELGIARNGSRGRVRLSSLPVAPDSSYPGIHAVRLVDRLKEVRRTDTERIAKVRDADREAEEWAEIALAAAEGGL